MLIPIGCWEEGRIRILGGPQSLQFALKHALADLIRVRRSALPAWIFVHVGAGRGQNVATHLHWHMCEPVGPAQPFLPLAQGSDYVVLRKSSRLFTALYGVIAGQVAIAPLQRLPGPGPLIGASRILADEGLLAELAEEAFWVVERYNRRFSDPDYCLMLALNSETDWYVRYTPHLSNWGADCFAAIDHGTPFVMPWPHQATAEHLLA
jgi:hypothetical protein